jgi:caffeoyl-CoA O-methyltransferase
MADRDSRAGRRYSEPEILEWVDRVHVVHDEALGRAFDAPNRENMPAIQVAPSEGRLISLLVKLAGARKVVEIGTLAGYSAIHIARSLPEDGYLWTIEFEAAHAKVARENIVAAGLEDRVEVVEGAAIEVLPGLEEHGPFDAVFVDADKSGYADYGRWARRNLRTGGLLLGDNAFLFGQLLEESDRGAAMRAFHEEAAEAFDSVCVPTPDGVLVAIKK